MTGVDVVIVTADTRELVLRCLERLDDPRLRTVVVDNASSDGTADAVRGLGGVEVVVLTEAVGFAAACNRGAGRGSAPLILFLNSDILATQGSIDVLVRALESAPDAVAAGGRLVEPGTRETQHRYGPKPFPTLATFAVRLSGAEQLWPGNPWTAQHLRHPPDGEHVTRVDQPAGACVLVRRDVFDELGGFDELFWFWYEDVDLARRLSDRGALLNVPGAVFEHVGGASFARWGRAQSVRSLTHGIVHYADVHFDRRRRLGLAALLIALSAPRALIFRARDPELAAVHRAILGAAWQLARGRRVAPLVVG
jgi:N-acetylglucosaminyl-diphospho-decaprenol L-rhamnosyltransferase